MKAQFIKTRPTMWGGNGFGTDGAEWVAFVGDTQVGHYANGGRNVDVFGQRGWYGVSATAWRRAIQAQAAAILTATVGA
jgi:hypothetical protein